MCSGDDVERASRSDCWPFSLQFSSRLAGRERSAGIRRRDLEPPPRCRMPALRADCSRPTVALELRQAYELPKERPRRRRIGAKILTRGATHGVTAGHRRVDHRTVALEKLGSARIAEAV